MGAGNSGATATESELVITRTFDAPRELVWKAWTEDMDKWSAPPQFTMPVSEGDVRPGGKWRACMKNRQDGTELWLGGVYREVVKPEKLVFTHAWDGPDGKPGPETLVTVTLLRKPGKPKCIFARQDSIQSSRGTVIAPAGASASICSIVFSASSKCDRRRTRPTVSRTMSSCHFCAGASSLMIGRIFRRTALSPLIVQSTF
jgi:Uncharacterized conserved protein